MSAWLYSVQGTGALQADRRWSTCFVALNMDSLSLDVGWVAESLGPCGGRSVLVLLSHRAQTRFGGYRVLSIRKPTGGYLDQISIATIYLSGYV